MSTTKEDPGKMGDEELASFVTDQAMKVAVLCEELRPYYLELRRRFTEKKSRTDTIAGCRTWLEFCETRLDRTKRAINYWLSGGNPVSKRSQDQAPAGKPFPAYTCSECGSEWSGGTGVCPSCEKENPVARKLWVRGVLADIVTWMLMRPIDRAELREAVGSMDEQTIKDLYFYLADIRGFLNMLENELQQRSLLLESTEESLVQ